MNTYTPFTLKKGIKTLSVVFSKQCTKTGTPQTFLVQLQCNADQLIKKPLKITEGLF